MVKKMEFGFIPESESRTTWRSVWKEFLLVFDLTVFMVASSYVYNLMLPLSMIFVGRLGTTYLDAVGLGNTIFNVFGYLTHNGMMTGCDTTMSQSYGTKNKKMVGVYFQRGVMIYAGLHTVCVALMLNSETLLVLLGQDREISRLAGQYVSYLCLSLHGFGIYSLCLRYFRIQNIIWPAIVVGLLTAGISILGHYIFLDVLGYGVEGSAYAQIIAFWVSALVTVALMPTQTKVMRKTWGGFTRKSLQDWGKLSSLSATGIFLVCVQWWGLEICTLLAGTIGPVELAAQSICFQMNCFIYTMPICVGVSCNILIGQHVGGGRPKDAQLNMRIGWVFTWVLSALNVILLLTLRDYIPTIFTTDPEVIEMTSETTVYLALYHVFECTATASLGMCRGIARQKMGSIVSFIGYYVIGLPLAITFTFQLDMGLKGLWSGLSVGLAFESALILYLLTKTDWKAECRAALVRAGLDPDTVEKDRKQDEYMSEMSDDAWQESSPLLTGKPKPTGTTRFRKRFNAEYASSQSDISIIELSGENLSAPQLIFYRGGYFAVCFLLLAIGAVLHFNVQMPYEMIPLCLSVNGTSVNSTSLSECA